MKTSLLIFISVLLNATAFASYRGEFAGQTSIEREIRWAWRHLPEFLISCQKSGTDCQTAKVQATLSQLVNYPPAWNAVEQTSWAGLLQFVSEKDHPELFEVSQSETHRLAVTSLQKNSIVYINTDRMDLPLETWIGVLTHEVVHHLGILDGPDRYPDTVGAEVAKHFKNQIQFSSLEQFKSPGTRTLTFSSAAEGHEAIGFFSNGNRTSDVGWEVNQLQPFCRYDEKIAKQFVSAPTWRLNRLQVDKGLVTVRGGGYVSTDCVGKSTQQRRTTSLPLDAAVTFQYAKPLNLQTWMNEVPAPTYETGDAFGPSNNPQDMLIGKVQTFLLESLQNETSSIPAGSVWKTTLILKSLDSFAPSTCQLFVAGTQSAYLTQDHLPGTNPFDACAVKSLGQGRWQINGQTRMPAGARPDLYYIPAVVLTNAQGNDDRTAIPVMPIFLRVTNPTAVAPPVIHGLTVTGVQPASRLGVLPLTNSYKVAANHSFQVSFIVEGPQKAFEPWLDIDIWYLLSTEFGIAQGTGSSDSLPDVLTHTTITPVNNGTRVSMDFTMVENMSGLQVAAFKLRRFYLRTSDYSWVEIELPDLHDHLIINDRYGE